MREDRFFVTGGVIVAVVLAFAYWLYSSQVSKPADPNDGPGPNLVIQVGGHIEGRVVIDLYKDVAPKHTAQLVALAQSGAYNNVTFHRVLEGFMAQTGDVQYGKIGTDMTKAGMGKSEMPDLPPEFSDISFRRGIVGMARADREDSANSQFFIMFTEGTFLDGKYTVVGHVIEGMDVIDQLKRGTPETNGAVEDPDRMITVSVE